MEHFNKMELQITAKDGLNTSDGTILVNSDSVQSEVLQYEDNKECLPRRNGLFSITGNLKVHRNTLTGKLK